MKALVPRLALAVMVATGGAFAIPRGGPASAAAAAVSITSSCTGTTFCYVPSQVRIASGDTVTWTNNTNGVSHTVTRCTPSACGGVDGGSGAQTGFGSLNSFGFGGTYAFTFTGTGTYNYYCNVHGYATMHGTVTNAVTPTGTVQAVLPAMANGAYGGYVTAATVKNAGQAPANVTVVYFDQSGQPVGAGDAVSNLPVNGSWTVRQDGGNAFAGTGGDAVQAGSALLYSTQPVASFVNEFPPFGVGDATSYTGVPVPGGVGATLYAPTIVNGAYGGYTTGIGLLNEGGSPTDVTVTYRDGGGATVTTQSLPALAGHAYHALYSGDATLALPPGFAGTATISGSAGALLGAVVNEAGPGGQNSSYDAVTAGATLLNAPVALNNAFGGYYTGMGVQNTSGAAGTVSIAYRNSLGAIASNSPSLAIAANGSLGVYQGSATDGPPPGSYTATIQSDVPIAAIVNEVAPPSGSPGARQSTAYNTFGAGSGTVNLPLVENGGTDPWNTGEGIMNTGATATMVTVTYYNDGTGMTIGVPYTRPLPSRAFLALYQPALDSGLPAGSRATAVVTTAMGGQVAVICNERSPTTFMSYGGQ